MTPEELADKLIEELEPTQPPKLLTTEPSIDVLVQRCREALAGPYKCFLEEAIGFAYGALILEQHRT